LSAQITPREFYQAIRQDDLQRLQSLLDGGAAVDLRDARGNTPLMHAAAIGSIQAMRLLLKAGADVNARSGLDATALVWCAADAEKAKLLIDAGAQVNVRTKMGRTPLMMAASHPGSAATVRVMLDKGADATAADVRGHTALVDAARTNSTEAVRLLLEHKGDIDAGDFVGLTALAHAASHSNVAIMRMLLSKGANVNAAMKREVKVRNGVIAVANVTPLMTAVARSTPETVRFLLEAGADVKRQDIRGMTPLMLAVASDVANPEVVRLLLDNGSDPDVKSVDGETSLDWAQKFGDPRILRMVGGQLSENKPQVRSSAGSAKDARAAIERAMPLLTTSSKEYFRMSGCSGCHHQHVIGMAVPAAARKGIPVDGSFARGQMQIMKSEVMGSRDALLQDIFISVDGLAFTMLGMGEQNYAPDDLTDAMVSAIAARQNEDGSWLHIPLVRPPLEDSQFVLSALSVRTIQRYSIPARRKELDARIAKAGTWLASTMPRAPYERAFQVMGLEWAGADRGAAERAVTELRRLQRPDGGWPQLATLPSDAFGTAVALYALRQARTPVSDAAYRRGVQFLLANQESDGSWHVRSRSPRVQPYFQSGFPHEHDQWISTAATAWAVTSLAEAVEPVSQSAALVH
jgi:ankyrin repeat protein